jgi:4a-hydroxytetrahydrobiopterin dehydratase
MPDWSPKLAIAAGAHVDWIVSMQMVHCFRFSNHVAIALRILLFMVETQRVARSFFAHQFPMADWRILRHSIAAEFQTTDFADAIEFVGEVGRAANIVGHHPDVEIRYPGKVRLTLMTHAVQGLTTADATLATTISELAKKRGHIAQPSTLFVVEIAIDAMNIPLVLPFWRSILGYINERPGDPESIGDAIVDPMRLGPSVWFQQMDESRTQRNRIHVDLLVPHDEAEARIKSAIAAGGTLVNSDEAPAFWVLADPEGNEICVCTWQGRD